MKHRIRIETCYGIDGTFRGYGWVCARCDECSEYFSTRLRAWWASLYYRRHGICRGWWPGSSR